MEYFVAGTPARTAGDLVGIHRNFAIRFFHKLREKIAFKQQNRSEHFCGKIELDESYLNIIALIIQSFLLISITTSMESKISGIRQKET